MKPTTLGPRAHAAPTAVAAVLLAAGAAHAATTRYTLTPIPSGSTDLRAALTPVAINSAGQLAGATGLGRWHAAVFTPGLGTRDLHPDPALLVSDSLAINESGQIVGDACIPPPGGNGACGLYVFRYTPGPGSERLNLSNSCTVAASGTVFAAQSRLNNAGAVAITLHADSSAAGGGQYAVTYSDANGWLDLTPLVPTTPVHPQVQVIDFNNAGQVLLSAGWQRPVFLYTPEAGARQVLPAGHTAVAMNDSAQIVGAMPVPGANVMGAYRYTDGAGVQNLDPSGRCPGAAAQLINARGMVSGTSTAGAFLYTDATGIVPIPTPTPVHLVGMNAAGDITAQGHNPVTYEAVPLFLPAGKGALRVQDLIDPDRSRIIVTSVSPINDAGRFAVAGVVPGTFNTTAISFLVTPTCLPDFDGSGGVDANDLSGFLNTWYGSLIEGTTAGDYNADGETDANDISAFINDWYAAVTTGC